MSIETQQMTKTSTWYKIRSLDRDRDTVEGVTRSRDHRKVVVDDVLGAVVERVKEEPVLEGDAEADDVSGLQEEVVVAQVIGVAVSRNDEVDVILETEPRFLTGSLTASLRHRVMKSK